MFSPLYVSIWAVSMLGCWSFKGHEPSGEQLTQVETLFPLTRRLVAASISRELVAREPLQEISNEAEFHFVQELFGEPLVARVSVQSSLPIFVLEEIEDSIDEIQCMESTIDLEFASYDLYQQIRQYLDELCPMIVVTAHDGCNEYGERTPHLISGVTSEGGGHLTLHTKIMKWHDAFQSTSVDLGSKYDVSHLELHDSSKLRKRQSAAASTTIVDSSGTPSPVSFSSPPASASATTINESINQQILNKVIMPPQIPVVGQLLPPLTMSCKNCSLSGSIEITKSSFTISGSGGILQDINETIQFFEHGSVELVAHNLFAHVELETQISPSQALKTFRALLPSIPLSPIEIPGVAVLGPLISPQILASITFTEQLTFTTGFNVSVPDGSTISLNMTELGNSTITGFDQATIHALPFQADLPIASLIFSLSLSPQILLGIALPGGGASGGIGAFLDLPQVSVNVTELSGVDGKCENGGQAGGLTDSVKNLFGNLTNIVPSVDLNVGVVGEYEVDLPGSPFKKTDAQSFTLVSTSFDLPTACLSYDTAQKTFGEPKASASATSTGGKSGVDKKSMAGRNVDVGVLGRPLAVVVCLVFFLFVS